MKRSITIYTIHSDKQKDFIAASENFVLQVKRNEPGVIEYKVYPGALPHSFVHFTSFENAQAEELHKHAPHTQIFMQLIKSYCVKKIRHISLIEKGFASGLCSQRQEDESKEQQDISLHRNQEDIDALRAEEQN